MSFRKECDVIIIGGGVVGCMIARFLSRYQLSILLIEKKSDIGSVTSAANSALVHAGYDAVPGSLKAEMNVKANPMWDQLAAELNFGYDKCGDFVVAIGKDELPKLDELMQRGRQNGVPDMSIISAEGVKKAEPLINPDVSGAVSARTGGICDPFGATIAAAENALMNGVEIMLETAFEDFIMQGSHIIGIQTNRGDFKCRWAVNAAGLYADTVMHQAGVRPDFKITPRRGEYYILDKAMFEFKNVIFPVPTEISKGILVAATIHGNPLVGPNAHEIEDKSDKSVTPEGLDEVWSGAKKLIPTLDPKSIVSVFAGLRAGGNAPCLTPGVDYNHDFIIEVPEKVQGFINLGGIESPGLTSAPAIAVRVVELMKNVGEKLVEKRDWNPIRLARPCFREMSHKQREALIANDPHYGRVVCRCENVTEGEIVAEIHGPIPARTYDAIKRRTWLGTGRCLGGFDMPRVVDILARELHVSPLEVSKKGSGSEFLSRETKEAGDD